MMDIFEDLLGLMVISYEIIQQSFPLRFWLVPYPGYEEHFP